MPIDPSIALGVRTPQPINPLEGIMQVMQLKQAQTLLPLKIAEAKQATEEGALRLQQTQKAINDQAASDAAWKGALTVGEDGKPTIDRSKLAQLLPGHLVAGATEALDKIDKSREDLLKVKNENQKATAEHGGGIGQFLQQSDYQPAAYKTIIPIEVAHGVTTPQIAQQLVAQIDAANQQDPTGAAAKALVKQHADQLIAMAGPQFTTAVARKSQAETQASEAAPRIAASNATTAKANAEIADKQHAEAIGTLAANPPPTKEAYADAIGELPKKIADRILKVIPIDKYDPKNSPGMLNQSAMTPEQRFQASKPIGERNPTEAALAFAVAKGKSANATPEQVQAGADADIALKRLDQSKIASRPITSITLTPDQMGNTAKMLTEGRIDPATARAMIRRNPGLLSQAQAVDPNFDEVQLDKRYGVAKEFNNTSNTKAGGQSLALNTLVHHADLYLETAKALKNGTFKPGNAAYNAVATAFGSAPPQSADLVARFFAGETGKVATGGVPAEGEINGILKNLSSSNSPAQIDAAGKALLQIAGGRAIPLMEKLKDAHLEGQYQVLGPDAKTILQRHGLNPETMKPIEQGAPSAPAIGTVKNGYKFKGGNPADPKSWEKQ